MIIKKAREVFDVEAKAIQSLKKRVGPDFKRAVNYICKCKGRIVVTGMGKGGIIGQKISATMSSLGTPSLWLHSAEAIHGDLGRVAKDDVVIVLSYSGETQEVKGLLPLLKKMGIKIISITGNTKSTLAKYSDIVLDISVKKEACPLGLAPTTSTTAMLAMGDALAVCASDKKSFKREDFAFFHPGGALGKRLLLKVEDIMRKSQSSPVVNQEKKIKEVLFAITKARAGSATIVDNKGKLVGIFTDGDLRRHLEDDPNLSEKKVMQAMTKSPTVVFKDMLAAEALRILQEKKIDELPVVDINNKPIGLLDVQDLLKAGLV